MSVDEECNQHTEELKQPAGFWVQEKRVVDKSLTKSAHEKRCVPGSLGPLICERIIWKIQIADFSIIV